MFNIHNVGVAYCLQVIHNISRKYHDAIVKCEVHNAVGKSEESEALDISCKCLQIRFPFSSFLFYVVGCM